MIAKKFITREIYAVLAIQVLLWLVDGYPAMLSLLSIGSHVLYLQNLRRFPIVKLSDPVFILSCGEFGHCLGDFRVKLTCSPFKSSYWQIITCGFDTSQHLHRTRRPLAATHIDVLQLESRPTMTIPHLQRLRPFLVYAFGWYLSHCSSPCLHLRMFSQVWVQNMRPAREAASYHRAESHPRMAD